jgi:hypothetical protein
MTMLKSKFNQSLVVKFLSKLSRAPNTSTFLDTYPQEKPGIIGQIESFLVDIMNNKKIGYHMRPDKMEKVAVEKSVYNTVTFFAFIQKHRGTLSSRNNAMFKTPLLVAISDCHAIKMSPRKITPLNKSLLRKQLIEATNLLNSWPDWYNRKDLTTKLRKGEFILSEIENARNIISRYIIYLVEQDERNAVVEDTIENRTLNNFTMVKKKP